MWMLNEEGIRDATFSGFWGGYFWRRGETMGHPMGFGVNKTSMSRVSVSRTSAGGPGRVSLGTGFTGGVPGVGGRMSPSPGMLQRASIVRVSN